MAGLVEPRVASLEALRSGTKVYLENVQGGIVADVDTRSKNKLVGWSLKPALDDSQYWIIDELGEGLYALRNAASGSFLTAAARSNGTQLTLSDTKFRWRIKAGSKRESFAFESARHTNAMMCNAYGKTNNGNKIWLWSFAPSFHDMMSWYLRKPPDTSSSSPSTPVTSPARSTIASPQRSNRSASILSGSGRSISRPVSGSDMQAREKGLADREQQIKDREAALQAAKDQLTERETGIADAEQQIKDAKEQLQQQLKEKQQQLQGKADELKARETQLGKQHSAQLSTATDQLVPDAGLEAELEKLRLENFDLASASEQAKGLKLENAKLKQEAAAAREQALCKNDSAEGEDAVKTREAIEQHDAEPFAEARRLKLELDKQQEEKFDLVRTLKAAEKERDLLRSQIQSQVMRTDESKVGGNGLVYAFDRKTHMALGGAIRQDFRSLERLQ